MTSGTWTSSSTCVPSPDPSDPPACETPVCVRHFLKITGIIHLGECVGSGRRERGTERGGTVEEGVGPSRDAGISGRQCGRDILRSPSFPQLHHEGPQGCDAVTGHAKLVNDPCIPHVNRCVSSCTTRSVAFRDDKILRIPVP